MSGWVPPRASASTTREVLAPLRYTSVPWSASAASATPLPPATTLSTTFCGVPEWRSVRTSNGTAISDPAAPAYTSCVREDDVVVRAPRGAVDGAVEHGGDWNYWSARDRELLELACGEESNPFPVRGEERPGRALTAGHRVRLQIVEGADEEHLR